jgi:Carboxypeptidase regulatory-like domain
MSSTKSAWITAGAVLLAAIVTGLFSLYRPTVKTTNFSGEIRNSKGQPISGARIIFAEDQLTPESAYSDDNGIFHLVLIPKVETLKITITAVGYDPISRDANPHRTGPEEFVLQPSVSPTSDLRNESPHRTLSTRGKNSPIVEGNGNTVTTPAR